MSLEAGALKVSGWPDATSGGGIHGNPGGGNHPLSGHQHCHNGDTYLKEDLPEKIQMKPPATRQGEGRGSLNLQRFARYN